MSTGGMMEQKKAGETLRERPLFLGLSGQGGPGDQIVEIAILDDLGVVLFHTLVKPTVSVALHDPSDAPLFSEIERTLKALLEDRVLVAYDASTAWQMFRQTAAANGLVPGIGPTVFLRCAMDWAAAAWGERMSLTEAARRAGVEIREGLRGAVATAELVRQLVLKMAEDDE